MNVDLKRTDKNLRELEKICGCCTCPCGGGPRSVTVRLSKQLVQSVSTLFFNTMLCMYVLIIKVGRLL